MMEEESKLMTFVQKHGSKLFIGTLATAMVFAWGQRFFDADKKSQQDYILAAQIFQRFQKGDLLPEESIETTINILNRHPELHPKYDAMLALTFLSQAKGGEAKSYVKSLLKKVDSHLPPLYLEYTKTTLLIAEENYRMAYEKSLLLKEQLSGAKGYENLEGMNLLRIVFLAERLGETAQKESTWQKLEHLPAYAAIEPLFKEGCISLKEYIAHK